MDMRDFTEMTMRPTKPVTKRVGFETLLALPVEGSGSRRTTLIVHKATEAKATLESSHSSENSASSSPEKSVPSSPATGRILRRSFGEMQSKVHESLRRHMTPTPTKLLQTDEVVKLKNDRRTPLRFTEFRPPVGDESHPTCSTPSRKIACANGSSHAVYGAKSLNLFPQSVARLIQEENLVSPVKHQDMSLPSYVSPIPITQRPHRAVENGIDDELKLHFSYQRHYHADQADLLSSTCYCHTSPLSDSASSCEDMDLDLTSSSSLKSVGSRKRRRTIIERLIHKQELDFAKYIPVLNKMPIKMPKTLVNKKDKKEYKEAKQALRNDRQMNASASRSSTRILSPDTSTRQLSLNNDTEVDSSQRKNSLSKSLTSMLSCVKIQASPPPNGSIKASEYETTLSKSPSAGDVRKNKQKNRYPKSSDARFDFSVNENFIKANTLKKPAFCAVLYAELSGENNFELCHLKTELAVSALLNFFHPYTDVQCLWMQNLEEKLLELLHDPTLRPKFTKLVFLRKFDAILVVDEKGGQLLRHKNTAFLHGLAASLEISPCRLLVMSRHPESSYRPFTA